VSLQLNGVFIPVCENMWGVLIFLRFNYIVGHAGLWEAWGAVALSFIVALLTTLSVSAIASNSRPKTGGVYALMVNALGHEVAGAVGLVYFCALCFLACLEMVGSMEALTGIYPSLMFQAHLQVLGSIITIMLVVTVLLGVKFVSRLGGVFAAVVAYSIFSVYAGLLAAPVDGKTGEPLITGLSSDTLSDNLYPDYSSGNSFVTCLGTSCFHCTIIHCCSCLHHCIIIHR
jgi:potassium/chloride transporter 4/5/6